METTNPTLIHPSEMTNDDLAHQIMLRYKHSGAEFIRPLISPSLEIEEVLQARIQRVQSIVGMQPEDIAQHYLDSYSARKPDEDTQDNLDKLINRRGQSAVSEGTLKELGLTRIEQILLLRGVVLATNARAREAEVSTSRSFSNRQEELQNRAVRSIHHFSTNPVHVCDPEKQEGRIKFLAAYSASYIAQLIRREVFATEPPANYDKTSIVGAMGIQIPFGRLLSTYHDKIQSIFAIEVGGPKEEREVKEFVPRHITEIDESRIVELKKLHGILGDTFTSYTFFDTVRPFVSVKDDTPPEKGTKRPTKREPIASDGDQQDDEDYVVLEIASREENGRQEIHVVADNAQINNACYAMRQEVLDEWNKLIGVSLKWQDVFSQPKKVARQLGAKRFVHGAGSNVPVRVREYLLQDSETVVVHSFSSLFDRNSNPKEQLFDDAMQPTAYNKMPSKMIEMIQKSEILSIFWPMIREHGYEQTYRLMNALSRGIVFAETEKVSRKRKESGVKSDTSADELWRAIIDADMRELYGKN